ncbi:MAG: RNA 3'-terminal phosphate cyclase [Endomicrobiia bacterium]
MITIDGSIGGGQVLRTALGLSCLLNKPFYITNIRKNRPNSGLQEQHLQCVLALAKLSDAEVKGAYKGSAELYFSPKKINITSLEIKISTAGSVGLVLQSLLIVGLKYPLNIKISGGATYGKWAPSIDFIDKVFCHWLRKLGMEVKINVIKHGFYPKGGAEVEVKIKPANSYEKIFITDLGEDKKINIVAVSSNSLRKRNVLERMVDKAKEILEKNHKLPIETQLNYVETICDGCGITICANTKNGVVGSSLSGEIGTPAEDIAKECVNVLLEDLKKFSLDRYSADQIIPYLGLVGGKVRIPLLTDHIVSNIAVVEKFINSKVSIKENIIEV